jgi:hypothetical protein
MDIRVAVGADERLPTNGINVSAEANSRTDMSFVKDVVGIPEHSVMVPVPPCRHALHTDRNKRNLYTSGGYHDTCTQSSELLPYCDDS